MLGIRSKAGIAAVGAAAAVALISSALPSASASSCSPSGGISVDSSNCLSGTYVNPLKGQSWLPGRIDMGVDLVPNRREPVVAIGDAKVLGSDSHSGWPG